MLEGLVGDRQAVGEAPDARSFLNRIEPLRPDAEGESLDGGMGKNGLARADASTAHSFCHAETVSTVFVSENRREVPPPPPPKRGHWNSDDARQTRDHAMGDGRTVLNSLTSCRGSIQCRRDGGHTRSGSGFADWWEERLFACACGGWSCFEGKIGSPLTYASEVPVLSIEVGLHPPVFLMGCL